MENNETFVDYLTTTVNPWIWEGYHKRGALSHYFRTRKISVCDASGEWCGVWSNIAINQTISLISSTAFFEIAREARSQKDYADGVHPDDIEEFLPFGCVSPLGTDAGLDALLHVAELSHEGHFSKVTWPFLVATSYETLTFAMSYLVFIAPVVFVLRSYLNGETLTIHSFAQSLAMVIASVVLSGQFKTIFRRMI